MLRLNNYLKRTFGCHPFRHACLVGFTEILMQEQTFQKDPKIVPIGLGRQQTHLKNRMRLNASNPSESAELGPRGLKLAISRRRRILVLADTTRAIISLAEQGLSKLIVFTNLLKTARGLFSADIHSATPV